MADETTTATTAGVINSSFISKVMLAYPINKNVLIPRVRYEDVTANGTGTAAFPIATKVTAAAIVEATGMSNSAGTMTNITATASEVGVLRTITKKASRFGILGDAGLDAWAIEDGNKLCLEKMETDALAIVTSASTSVGTAGGPATVGIMAGAISQASINNADGEGFFVWSKFQSRDMRAAVASSSAPILSFIGGANLMNRADSAGLLGTFMGQDVYESGLCPTVSADKVGVYAIDGTKTPSNAPIGCARGWMPEVERDTTAQLPGKRIAVTACYGFAEISDFNYTKIVSIGS